MGEGSTVNGEGGGEDEFDEIARCSFAGSSSIEHPTDGVDVDLGSECACV